MPPTAHILVVDDEPGIREGCRRVLGSEGHQVETAENGKIALQMVQSGGFELLLVDVKMPSMGGIDLVRQVQRIDATAVCVMITGYATIETAIEATKSGAYDFLPKPFTPDELLVKVNKALERRELILEAQRLREDRERSLLEISLEKSRLLTIINCMLDGVLVTNRDGQLVLHNPAALALLQLRDRDAIGKSIEQCLPIPPLVQLVSSALADTTSSSDATLSQEVQSPDGSRVLLASVAPVRDDRAELLGSVTVVRDITESKRLDRMKSQFVAMVAHELRTPLAVVQGYTDVMLSGAAGDPSPQFRQMLERSKDRTSSLLNLIDDLLDVSSIEAGRIARRIEPIQLPSLLVELVEMVRPKAEARAISFLTELPGTLPEVRGDREDMIRLFTNLLTNAIKYNKEGGTVRIAARTEGGQLRVEVVDTGVGIAKESIPKIFDEFYRVKTPETRQITGTGLGLSIVKKIVEAHHGWIEVESELGVGSSFSVFLPIVETVFTTPPGNGDEHPGG